VHLGDTFTIYKEKHTLFLYLANSSLLVSFVTNRIEELDILGHVEVDGIRCEWEMVLDRKVIPYLQPDVCVYDFCSEREDDRL
jgi:hypothetical protein